MDANLISALGDQLAPIWWDPRRWLHRVVESFRFVDAATIRRSASFDLTVPTEAPVLAGRTVLPLALLDRRVLAELDVMDEAGRRLPMLTSAQNGAVSGALLVAATRAEAIHHAGVLEAVALLPTREGGDLAAALSMLSEAGASGRLEASATALARGFVVYVLAHAAPGERTIVKLSYAEPLEQADANWRTFLGWKPLEVAFLVRAAGEAGSYHFEIHAPEGGTVADAVLAVATSEQSDQELPSGQLDEAIEPGRVAHLHLTGVPRGATGKAVVRVAPGRGGWVSSALAAAWFTASTLCAAWVLRSRLAGSGEASVTLLLVVNGLVSALGSRPAPHDLTATLLRGPRYLTLALAAASYVAAGAFVLSLEGGALAVTLILCAATALVCAVALQRAWLASR